MTSTKELIAGLRAIADGFDMFILEGRYLRVANPKFAEDNGENPWLVIDTRDPWLEALAAPVEGMEIDAEELGSLRVSAARAEAAWNDKYASSVQRLSATIISVDGELLARLIRSFDRFSSALAAKEQERSRSDDTVQELGLRLREEQARNERLVGALRKRDDDLATLMLTTDEHLDGCLYRDNPRLPCQCGWSDRRRDWFAVKDRLTTEAKAHRAALQEKKP